MKCPLCKTPLTQKEDKYYFHCDSCKAHVKNPCYYLSMEDEKAVYQKHENDINDRRYQEFTSPITEAILQQYLPHHIGLDYGCGTGPVISKLLSDYSYQVKLYDPYFFPDEEFLKYQYDYIFCCEVFEHFHEPAKEIEKLLNLLKTNGRLYIMTHVYDNKIPFEKWYYRNDPTHVFIYQKETFEYISNKYDLQIEKLNERFIILKK
jgi:SAM-dependent methyltransferase